MTTNCYTVHDAAGFDALPAGTKLEDADGDHFEKMEEGYRAYGDAAPYYNYLYLETPAVVLNPEVLGLTFPLQVGDRATINGDTPAGAGFRGLAVEVVKVAVNTAYVRPLTERPDGYGLSPFWWDADELVPVIPEPDEVFVVIDNDGDLWVSRTSPELGYSLFSDEGGAASLAYIEQVYGIDGKGKPTYEVGDRVLVTYDTGGSDRYRSWDGPGTVTDVRGGFYIVQPDHMEGSGGFYAESLSPYVDPEPEPVHEAFDIEAGTYVQSQEGLDALPNLTIVDPIDSYFPIIKVRGQWRCIGHIYQYPEPVDVDWIEASVIERGGVVLYASATTVR